MGTEDPRICRHLPVALGVLSLVLAWPACGAPRRSPLDQDARRYVRLGVALGERDPDSLDFYAGRADAVAEVRRDPPALQTIRADARLLMARLAQESFDRAAGPRVHALSADLSAMIARVDLLTGTRLRFDQETAAFFGVAPVAIDQHRLADTRARIARLVGSKGRLVDRYAAFASRYTVPPDRLELVMRAALDECRRRTMANMALPPGEQVALEFVRDKPWSAFSRYLGDAKSTIQINTDFLLTVDQALQLACHEGYPGHHVRNSLTAPHRDPAGLPPERSIQLMFTPEALASEASAMLAVDAAFSSEERVRFVRDRLFPLVGLDPGAAARHVEVERLVGDLQIVQADIARRYLDGELEFARAVTALEEQALVPHAEALVKYINEYRSYVTTYTIGSRILAAQIAACAGPDPGDDIRWRCFKTIALPVELAQEIP